MASQQAGVGPRQRGNDGSTDAVGGKTYAIGTVEMTFPVGLPEQWGITGEVFSDFGTVFNSGVDTVLAGQGDCSYGNNKQSARPQCAELHQLRHACLPPVGRRAA